MTSAAEIDVRVVKCQKILDADPNSQIFAALAEACRRKGDIEKAFSVCQNGLKIHPSYGSAHVVMAKINLDRGLYDWAEIEAKKAAEIDGRTRATELLLAEIYIYKGEYGPAIKLLKRLHESDPRNGQITRLLEIARQLPEQLASSAERTGSEQDRPQEAVASEYPEQAEPPAEAEITISEVLKRGIAIAGLDGVLFVNREGLVVESQWAMRLDSNVCGAVMVDVSNVLNRQLIESCFGGVTSVLIETEGPVFYLVKGGGGMFLFVGNASANLGTIRMKIESLLQMRIVMNEKDTAWK